ncbi:MAG: ATP-dependent proteinase, serine peptidase, MEROPS family S16 [Acidobacteria bacterium OLB17]|nr:MAG: ATP-dependent proteinase, serine peptidase, MEROPS family S16 [Acidobacteria bacterium OLB17]
MAAHRAGIRRIILPDRNEPDTDEIPDDVKKELEFIPVKYISEVLKAALEPTGTPPKVDEYRPPSKDEKPHSGEQPSA